MITLANPIGQSFSEIVVSRLLVFDQVAMCCLPPNSRKS